MRGDQLARQWRVARAIQGSPLGLTKAEETLQRKCHTIIGILLGKSAGLQVRS